MAGHWIFTMASLSFFDDKTRFFETETNLRKKGLILCNHSGSGAVFHETFFAASGASKVWMSLLPHSLQKVWKTCCKSPTATDGSGTSLPMALKHSRACQPHIFWVYFASLGATALTAASLQCSVQSAYQKTVPFRILWFLKSMEGATQSAWDWSLTVGWSTGNNIVVGVPFKMKFDA